MTKMERLLAKYYRANADRHNLYCYRSRKRDKWTPQDEEKLALAISLKREASKELRTYLKDNGMCIIWGDRCHVDSVKSIDVRKKENAEVKRARVERQLERSMRFSMNKLDLI